VAVRSFPLLLGIVSFFAASCSSPRPNILLITLDTTRADHLGCYGKSGITTPVLDSLANAGTRFASASTPSPLTLPAHVSMLTGLYPWEHGVRDNGLYSLSETVSTVVPDLTRSGYWCGAVIAAYPLIRQYGLSRGFAEFDDEIPAKTMGFVYPERKAQEVTTRALSMMERRSEDRPWFLWVHYFDPHAPYVQEMNGQTRYDAEIALMDREIGRLLEGVPRGRLVVFVAGDHGEGLGEHGEDTHGDMLYSSTANVPLIVCGIGWPVGDVRVDPVSIVDIAPTMRAVVGLSARSCSGSDLRNPSMGRFFPAETLHPLLRYGWPPLRAVTRREWKIIQGEKVELYNLSDDPGELNNLASAFPETVRTLTELLPPLTGIGGTYELSSEDRKALSALGYFGEQGEAISSRTSLWDLLEEANRLVQSGQWQHAGARFSEVLDKDSGNLLARIGLGTCFVQMGNLAAADSAFRRVLSGYPAYLPAIQNLAMVRLLMEDDVEAEELHREVLRLMPGDVNSLQALAVCLRRQRKYEESLVFYEHLATIRPRDARLKRDIGSLLAYDLRRIEEGVVHWREALRLDPAIPQRHGMEREMRRWGFHDRSRSVPPSR